MAARKTYLVKPEQGVNLRAKPSKDAGVICVLPCGMRISVDQSRSAPEGWIAVDSLGYIMAKYLK